MDFCVFKSNCFRLIKLTSWRTSPSWEADCRSRSQAISCHWTLPLSHVNPVNTLTSCYFKIIGNIYPHIYTLCLPSRLFLAGFPSKNVYAFLTSSFVHVSHLNLLHLFTLTILDEEQRLLKFVITQFSPVPCAHMCVQRFNVMLQVNMQANFGGN
jgi:hypothetical protein